MNTFGKRLLAGMVGALLGSIVLMLYIRVFAPPMPDLPIAIGIGYAATFVGFCFGYTVAGFAIKREDK